MDPHPNSAQLHCNPTVVDHIMVKTRNKEDFEEGVYFNGQLSGDSGWMAKGAFLL